VIVEFLFFYTKGRRRRDADEYFLLLMFLLVDRKESLEKKQFLDKQKAREGKRKEPLIAL
jgi:hypothetical protein